MSETPNREVNADTEVLNLDDESTEEETPEDEEDLDETVIPPVDEGEEPEPEEEDKEKTAAAAESSPEDPKPEEAEEAHSKVPAPVPGETPRERALRAEIVRLRILNRKNKVGETVGEDAPAPKDVNTRLAKLRETYSPEEIANMEEAIDVLAESKGYVKASTTYQQAVNDVVEAFVESNPEFKPENDPDDIRWNKFHEILTTDYNVKGKNSKELARIFTKVKGDVDKELGEPETVKVAAKVATEDRKTAAQRQKIKSVSHSGGTKSPTESTTKKIDPAVRGMFKGFDEEDLVD